MNINAFNNTCEFVCTKGKIHVFKYRVASRPNTFVAVKGTIENDKLTEGCILTQVNEFGEHDNHIIFRTIEEALNCVPTDASYKWETLNKFTLGTIIDVSGNYYLVVELMNNEYKDKYKVIQLKSESAGYCNTMHILKEDDIVIRNGRAVFTLE